MWQKAKWAVLDKKTGNFISFEDADYGDGCQNSPIFESVEDAEDFMAHCVKYTDFTPVLSLVKFTEQE